MPRTVDSSNKPFQHLNSDLASNMASDGLPVLKLRLVKGPHKKGRFNVRTGTTITVPSKRHLAIVLRAWVHFDVQLTLYLIIRNRCTIPVIKTEYYIRKNSSLCKHHCITGNVQHNCSQCLFQICAKPTKVVIRMRLYTKLACFVHTARLR